MKMTMDKGMSCCCVLCQEREYYPEECRGCTEIEGKVFWPEYTGEPFAIFMIAA